MKIIEIFLISVLLITSTEMQIVDSSELSGDMLRNRNGNIIIEKSIGIVTSAEGDGEVLNCRNSEYNYISYKSVSKANVGDKILTYLVYNPENNYVDDILYRFDFIIE